MVQAKQVACTIGKLAYCTTWQAINSLVSACLVKAVASIESISQWLMS
jgi:hypothetical protein